MKKLIPLLLVAAGATAYYVNKKIKESNEVVTKDFDDIKVIKLDDDNCEELDACEDIEPVKVDVKDDQIDKIKERYNYLTNESIYQAFSYYDDLKNQISNDEKIGVVHVSKFALVEDMIAFIKWIRNDGYSIRESDEDNTVMAFKDSFINDESFLDDIFTVANITVGFKGEYLGFNIEKN